MKHLGIVLFAIGMIGLGVWWQVYKWNDCRQVGHSWLYCVARIAS